MDPKQTFQDRYQQFVNNSQNAKKENITLEHKEKRKFSFPQLKLGYLFIALLALSVPPTLALIRQPQDVRQRASGPENQPNILISVGQNFITSQDVDLRMQLLFGNDYEKIKNDPKIRQTTLDEIIKEKILQQEAAKRSIVITEKEVAQKMTELGGNNSPLSNTLAQNAVMEEKLKDKVVNWKKVDYAAAFEADEEKTKIITDSLQILKQAINPTTTLKAAYDNLKNTKNFYNKFRIIEGEQVFGKGGWDETLSVKLFSYKKGDISNIIDANGTYRLAVVLDENITKFDSFDEWYNSIRNTIK